jgi:acyl carrier protein
VFSLTEAGGLAHGVIPPGEEPPSGPLAVGRVANGIEIVLADERGRPVPPGESGEIVVRSPHLSPGYWRDEQLTDERFSERAGARELRTGDLGRLDDAGGLVVIGRRDAQVKIRGYRVEIGEVEDALRALPEVEAAAAWAQPTRHGDARLTAYLVARDPGPPAPAEVRESLRASLPEASIPTAIAFVEELPLNEHGKVDRERLSELTVTATAAGAQSTPPAGELERTLSGLWGEALGLERVGREDDFFDLGGDSLAAAEIGAGVHAALGVELDMRAFSGHPTVAGMAELVRELRGGRGGAQASLGRVPRDRPLPCSFAQERIWEFCRDQRSSVNYTVAGLSFIDEEADLEALRDALAHVAGSHEPLRTTFAAPDGAPSQIVHPEAPVDVQMTDVSDAPDPQAVARGILWRETQTPFDLEHGPLLRLHLARVAGGRHLLMRVGHHLVSDRISWRIFFTDVVDAYDAIRNGSAPAADEQRPQYADFAAWQRRSLRPDGPRYREQVAWWRHALAPTPPALELPFRRGAPEPSATAPDAFLHWGIDPPVAATLDRLGRERRVTYYAVRLALFSALLGLETGQEQVTIGAYVDTRRLPETRSMFGYFSNLITLVLPFDPSASLRAWIAKVGFLLVEAIAHSDLPHQLVQEELAAAGGAAPAIDAIFAVHYPLPQIPFGEVEPLLPNPRLLDMPWGFTFTVDQGDESRRCLATFDAHLHDPAAVRRFVDRYVALAELAGANPDRRLGDLHPALR